VRELPDLGGLFLLCPVIEPDFGKRAPAPRRVVGNLDALGFESDDERAAFAEVAVACDDITLAAFRRAVHPANRAVDRAVVDAVRARYCMALPYAGALASLDKPACIACGRDDHWVGYHDAVRVLLPLLPRGELHVLRDCGHLLPLEDPARFRALLGDWLTAVG
jgi:pimeloyl-ACP methyl ester carboxylesterase